MSSSLFTALSGMQASQGWIDVIGNNLANSNTPGFKSSSATFSDAFSSTLRHARAGGATTGGVNPMQVGHGVRLADIARSFDQGALSSTGRTFDVALQGRGFFALEGNRGNVFSRVGTFGLDGNRNLVDQRTGYRVLDLVGQPIEIDPDALFPPQRTGLLQLTGNLPAVVNGPLQEELTGAEGLKHGAPAALTSTVPGPWAVPTGETWSMELQVSGGPPQLVSVTGPASGTVTAADVAAAIDALEDVTATVNGAGEVEVATDRVGEDASLRFLSGDPARDLAGLVGLSTVLVTGTEAPVGPTTTLNDLPGNLAGYQPGDVIHVTGVDADGAAVNAAFTYGAANDGETVDAFVAFLDGLYPGSDVSLNASGQIVVEAQTAGEADLLLSIADDGANVGSTQWSQYALSVSQEGTGPDVVTTSTEVYDPAGVAHTMTLDFERQQDGTWTVTPSLQDASGQVLSNPITGLTFDDDGTPTGLDGLAADVTVQFAGQGSPQTLSLDLGEDGGFGGITELGADGTLWISEQDGYGVGELANISIDTDGTIEGFYTNGQTEDLAVLGIATFGNPEGLRQVGDNYWGESANSGPIVLGRGDSGVAGQVIGGAIEGSNVDTAEQFVHLIEAQRGFQANARVISTQDEILAEMVNLI